MYTKCSDCGEWFFYDPVDDSFEADFCLFYGICPECCRKKMREPTNFINRENFEMMRDFMKDEMKEATDNVSS